MGENEASMRVGDEGKGKQRAPAQAVTRHFPEN